ncbi:uncharacterized protein LOC132193520 [Neocloeon triangulifer]|uniref:uncharacterized protein LOC132193520 n=1 Tax=Neocloeon triangulifer TaxID=2078957 RepID=UPI00286F1139|nr:uncharacterized protein LOC132193520 [Neocloeon triangulifer]
MNFAAGILLVLLQNVALLVRSQDAPPVAGQGFWKPVPSDTVLIGAVTHEEFATLSSTYEDGETIPSETYTVDSFQDAFEVGSFGIELWLIALDKLKAQFKFVTPKGSSKNTLSAVTQMVANGQAHFAFIPTVYVPEDTKGVVITQPTHSVKYKLFVQSPTSVSTSLSLGTVFTPVLWLTIVISMLMMGAILIFIEFLGQRAKITSYLARPADVGQLVIIVIGCFCFQGAIQIASGCSGRVLVWTSLTCGYLIYVSFNTEVISQLTTVSFKPPIESLQDMALKGTHKLIVRNETSLLEDIKITRIKDGKRGILADVWDKLLPMKPKAENLYNDKKEINRLCKEKVAILDSDLAISPKDQQKYKCNTMTLKDSYFRSNLGFVLNKNNTFNKQIIKMFSRMRETGIINRMRRYIDQPDVGPLKPLPDLNPIEINTLIPMLVVLYVGMIASVVTLGLEIAFKHGGGELIRRLNERGYYTWKDVVCFWRVKRPNPDEESSEESESSEDEEAALPSSVPTIKVPRTPATPAKIKRETENKSKFVDRSVPPRPLKRENRVSQLNNFLPNAGPVYLDKNTLRDNSSEESNFNSPRSADGFSPRVEISRTPPLPIRIYSVPPPRRESKI